MRSASLSTSGFQNKHKLLLAVNMPAVTSLARDFLKLLSLVAIVPTALVALLMLTGMGDINFVSTASGLTTDFASVSGPIQAMQGGVEGFGN